jgi:hypothetical protein
MKISAIAIIIALSIPAHAENVTCRNIDNTINELYTQHHSKNLAMLAAKNRYNQAMVGTDTKEMEASETELKSFKNLSIGEANDLLVRVGDLMDILKNCKSPKFVEQLDKLNGIIFQ